MTKTLFAITFISTLFLRVIHARFIYHSPLHSLSQSYGLTETSDAFTEFDLTHNINIFEFTTPTQSIAASSSPRRFKTQQYFQGLPVFGATLVIEEGQDHSQAPLVGHWYDPKQMMQYIPDTTPDITAQDALQIVLDMLDITVDDIHGTITNELYIYHIDRPYLAYNVRFIYANISQVNDAFETMSIIHAFHPHNILKHYHQPRTFKACGSGGNAKIGSWLWCDAKTGPDIVYTDTSAIPELANDDFEVYDKGNRVWSSDYDDGIVRCKKLDSATCKTDSYDAPVNGAYGVALDAYAYSANTFAMYREWMDEAPVTYPKPFPVYVHVGVDWNNANFDTDSINFGDGDGTEYHPLTSASITAHEFAHGYTDQYSDLTYYGQSGGMNEAYSDIAGESAEYYLRGITDWRNGYDITCADTGPPDDASRYLKDPPLDGKSVGHWCDYYDGINVHYSSGIYNKAAYLMSVDTTYAFSIQEIFTTFSTANKYYWTKDSTMKQGVCGLLYALSDLYADVSTYSQMETSLVDSFNSVGLSCYHGSEPYCGDPQNTFTYNTTMIPSTSGDKTASVMLQAWDNNNERMYFDVYFTIKQSDCINPKITFKLDRLDYDDSSHDEVVEVYDNDLSLIQSCTVTSVECTITDTCINAASVNNGATITKGTSYMFTVVVGADVDALCSDHDMILNSQVQLTCDKVPIPTVSPTPVPTEVPTKHPTRTLNPSIHPTVSPTTTLPPTERPTANPTARASIAVTMMTEYELDNAAIGALKAVDMQSIVQLGVLVVLFIIVLVLLCVVLKLCYRRRKDNKEVKQKFIAVSTNDADARVSHVMEAV